MLDVLAPPLILHVLLLLGVFSLRNNVALLRHDGVIVAHFSSRICLNAEQA